jgi:[acyl-carrier-protein] S-malonyltransferase
MNSTKKTAFLFSGQGAQTQGMATALSENCPKCRELFAMADSVLGLPLYKLMTQGSADELKRTEVAQPALLAVSVAEAKHLIALGANPVVHIGHSVGQYSALVAAHSISVADGLRLVRERGRLMQKAVPEGVGAMCAIVGLERERVREVCAEVAAKGVVEIACHNAPGQTVVSGEKACVDQVAAICEDEGGGAVPLPVSAPFHCSLLAPMVPEFARLVNATEILPPRVPVLDNVTGLPLKDAESVRRSLIAQITKPVLFEESLRWLFGEGGIERAIQCGPGSSLLGFARRVRAEAILETFEQAGGLERVCEAG